MVADPQLYPNDTALMAKIDENGTACLSRLGYDAVSEETLMDFDDFAFLSKQFPLLQGLGVPEKADISFLPTVVIFDLAISFTEDRPVKLHQSQRIG